MLKSRFIKRSFYISSFSVLTAILVLITIYFFKIHTVNHEYYDRYNGKSEVNLRKFPYPYKAAIAICSDIDNTETLEEFLEIQRFLNTREMTSMGEGLGLEIGNSFLSYEPPDGAISYYLSGPFVRKTIINFIKSGQIDVMHSYGKKSDFTREDAVKSLADLKKTNCRMDVWVDHDRSISNLGDDVTFGFGDHRDSKAYHADVTLGYGIRFAWLGRVTMIAGQSAPITIKTFTNIYDLDHPLDSLINVGKELAKNALAVFGNKKYAMHGSNDLVKIATLDDGNRVYEFTRFDNFWEGVATGATNKRLAYVISGKTLDRLKETEGYMIVYTHFGKNSDSPKYVCEETQDALRNLAEEYRTGNIYVTTTSKLLNYYVKHKYLNWSTESKNGEIVIQIYNVKDPISGTFTPKAKELRGITFYTPDRSRTRVLIGGQEVEKIEKNPADFTGKESVMIK